MGRVRETFKDETVRNIEGPANRKAVVKVKMLNSKRTGSWTVIY